MAFETESFYGPRTSTPKPKSVYSRSHQRQKTDSFFRVDMIDASDHVYNKSTLSDESCELQSHLYQQYFTTSSEDSNGFEEIGDQEYKTERKDLYDIKTHQMNNLFLCVQLKLHTMQMRMSGGEKMNEMDGEIMLQNNSFSSPITVITDGVKHTAM